MYDGSGDAIQRSYSEAETGQEPLAAYNTASSVAPAVTSVFVAALGKNGYVVMNPKDHARTISQCGCSRSDG